MSEAERMLTPEELFMLVGGMTLEEFLEENPNTPKERVSYLRYLSDMEDRDVV